MQGTSGVYRLRNLASGDVYIGSARLFRRRFSQHRTALRCGKHQNPHLQAAWGKYGEAAFHFEVLIVCAPSIMRFYEQRCIDVLRPKYNKSTSAYSGIPIGATLSPQHRGKVGIASRKLWGCVDYRDKTTQAIRAAMTQAECVAKGERTRKLWADPMYREKAVAARVGNAYNKGYKCTPEQVENRRRAARISNMKRNYGEDWRCEYARRYPEHVEDINA